MSRYFPTSEYAEDQPFPHTILASHVLYRGFQAGAIVGLVVGSTSPALSSLYSSAFKRTSTASTANAPLVTKSLIPSTTGLLKSVGRGAVSGTVALTIGLAAQMRGKEHIEWADRSWRLLRNEGQMEVDDWSLVGTAVGAVFAAQRVGPRALLLLGGAGLGNIVGVSGYVGWRYGVKKGKR